MCSLSLTSTATENACLSSVSAARLHRNIKIIYSSLSSFSLYASCLTHYYLFPSQRLYLRLFLLICFVVEHYNQPYTNFLMKIVVSAAAPHSLLTSSVTVMTSTRQSFRWSAKCFVFLAPVVGSALQNLLHAGLLLQFGSSGLFASNPKYFHGTCAVALINTHQPQTLRARCIRSSQVIAVNPIQNLTWTQVSKMSNYYRYRILYHITYEFSIPMGQNVLL